MEKIDIPVEGWHKITRFRDSESGLDCIISVHDTTLGPGCGGCRVYPYTSFEAGLDDVKLLSRGMTFKNALAGIPFGGGKAVIFADPKKTKTPEMMAAFGKAVDALGGLYHTAEDSGMSEDDINIVRSVTPFAAGASRDGIGGNPSPHTGRGIWRGIEAAARHRLGRENLTGLRVSILGVGAVGMSLADYLHKAGAELIVADVNDEALLQARRTYDAQIVSLDEIYDVEVDVFSPCALGGAINPDNVDRLTASIVAGAANNQLVTDDMGRRLHERDILYAPDYIINAAGVMSVGLEITGDWTLERLNTMIDGIGTTLTRVFESAAASGQPPHIVADRMARDIISAGR